MTAQLKPLLRRSRVAAHDPDQRRRSTAAKKWRMILDPRRASIIEAAGIATAICVALGRLPRLRSARWTGGGT
jgi:hypothetical protein